MGSCIICGKSVDGRICDLHEEDVVFEFRGNQPDQLTVDRYYRGTVDGYAEFGVFVDVGDSVTGLLHRSELDQRLESLDWESGDTVFVQVQQVRDNGNVDLGWSIRQAENEFRGTLVDDPDQGAPYLKEDESGNEDAAADDESAADASDDSEETDDTDEADTAATEDADAAATEDADVTTDDESDEQAEPTSTADAAAAETPAATTEADAGSGDGGTAAASGGAAAAVAETENEEATEPNHVAIETLDDRVGETVRLEGVVESARQTSGPTVFEIRDETDSVECAAFKEAAVRAYPEIDTDDVVRLDGEVRERRGELQVETEALVKLEDDDRTTVEDRLADALTAQAEPDAVDPIVADETVEALTDDVRDVATAVRRAVLEERPVVVRHAATADGYVAGVALERATLPLVRDQHDQHDAVYHYFDRRPLEEGVYDMDDATKDATRMLEARERHDEKLPLFVFVAAGATRESLDGFELLDLYGAGRALVDDVAVDPEVDEAVDAAVAPDGTDAQETTAATLAANVAAHVNDEVREDLRHLPAVSYWEDTPEAYADAASEAGYDADAAREVREAVALEAYYQSYEDKRELITDLLFGEGDGPGGLAGHVSEQFREKLDTEIETAEANLDTQTLDDTTVAVLDTDAFTHRYEFPPTALLLDELHRRHRDDVSAVIGVSDDELHIRSDHAIDVRDVADRAREWVPNAGLTAASARHGKLEYIAGERSAVLDTVIDVVADEVA
ncbi:putative nuclease/nucleic acid binding OB-fold tRNA/helicase-type [Halosimplex carlsbadense 2-9-1]|uniref:Putative nuclease/nucleic acid binding OB-fold tRNA/helicase-type n=1 Tax=Halosimplex carlsbadense 2-9-1 TaxID=797114 RepID=M0CQF7_9EURY|nr:OB-fold nucleic acid binding domain-containing protein [Halosimplex carlsbadense]ELZ25471.1 putative nuclease/nucleic acid binding OB-fold tRNA/helicase-type [Halosimplex carlsbadense 2-9-1]